MLVFLLAVAGIAGVVAGAVGAPWWGRMIAGTLLFGAAYVASLANDQASATAEPAAGPSRGSSGASGRVGGR